MYQTDVSLPAALDPSAYTTQDAFESDKKALTENGWQLVAPADLVSKPGDNYALEILDVPIVLRNHDNELVAFRNVRRSRVFATLRLVRRICRANRRGKMAACLVSAVGFSL